MTAKLECVNLSRTSGSGTIVDGVDARVGAGETVAVVGPSGAGKSSFLRLLNRLDEPTAGTVKYDGEDYRSLDPQTLRKRVGLVPQGSTLVDGTVYRNVTLGPRLRGEAVDDERAESLLERVGLPDSMDRSVETLSGGEAQRVAIARTLMNEPTVLLLDEPTASLDPETEAEVERLLEEIIREESLTCIFVTHDESQAHRLASRVLEFVDGEIANARPTNARPDTSNATR